jgi:hypothetical protein
MAKADDDNARLTRFAQAARAQAAIPESTREALRHSVETVKKYAPSPAQMRTAEQVGAHIRRQIENSPGLRRISEDMRRLLQGESPAADQVASPPHNKIKAEAIAYRKPTKKEEFEIAVKLIRGDGVALTPYALFKEVRIRFGKRGMKLSDTSAKRWLRDLDSGQNTAKI